MVELDKIANQPRAYTDKQKIEAIREACKPGQPLTLDKAIDLLCDIWLATKS